MGTPVGIASATPRRATVYVGETCREVLEGAAPAAGALLETPWSFSFADPPIAVGAEGVVLLCEAHQPRPIAPPMSKRRPMPMTQTQRDRRVVPFCVFRSQALWLCGFVFSSFATILNRRQKSSPL